MSVADEPARNRLRAGSVVAFYGIWTIFLGIPLYLVIADSGPAIGWRIAAALAIVAFGIVYVRIGIRGDHGPGPCRSGGFIDAMLLTLRTVAPLFALALVTVPALGANVLAFAPYFTTIGLFQHTIWRGFVWTGIVVAAMFAVALLGDVPLAQGSFLGPLGGVVFLVLIRSTFGQAELEQRSRQEQIAVREREAISRDVHDILGHSLTVIVLKAQLAKRLIELDPHRAEQELDDVLAISQAALGDVRATVGRLRIPDLASQVDSARESLVDAGLEVRVEGTWQSYDPEFRALAAWTIREATTNILRHAGASHCVIRFRTNGFEIVDDGSGIGGVEGHGLTGLRSRVEEAGATLEVGPAHPLRERPGTRVEVTRA